MQAELFKKNAILIMCDDSQSLLYSDILSINGFNVKVTDSIMELMNGVNSDINLALIDVDVWEGNTTAKIVQSAKNKFPHLFIVGVSVYKKGEKETISNALDCFITKPSSVKNITDDIFSCFSSKERN